MTTKGVRYCKHLSFRYEPKALCYGKKVDDKPRTQACNFG
jgi:hypothetical protein